MRLTPSWVAYSEKVFRKAQAADDALIRRGPSTGSIAFEPKRGPAPTSKPKPHYSKGDTTAASARIAEIRRVEKLIEGPAYLGLKVERELIASIEEQAARFRPRFKAIIEGILATPFQPARRGECPAPPMPIAGPVELTDGDLRGLAVSPAAVAIVALCGCRWPIGEPTADDFRFCNKKRAQHFYCEAHARKAKK